MEFVQYMIQFLFLLQCVSSIDSVTEKCSLYNNQYFPCINDCGCGMCGRRCLPATQKGEPKGCSCDNDSWITNTPSLACAIHDEAIAPILTALLSTVIATACVVLIIILLLFIHRSFTYCMERNNIDPIEVVCNYSDSAT